MAEESFAWSMWTTGANAMFVFLYVFSISIAYVTGGYIVNPIVLAGLGFLIPYFSFFVLPIILILFTAITRQTIIN